MITYTLDMVQHDCPYIDVSDDFSTTFTGVHWDFDAEHEELESRVLVKASTREELHRSIQALHDHPKMNQYELLSVKGDRAILRNRVSETTAMRTIRGYGGYLTGPFEAEHGSEVWNIGFDSAESADAALSSLDRNNEFAIESRDTISIDDFLDLVRNVGPAKQLLDGCRNLTAVERATMEQAYSEGYFRSPRDATLSTLAEEFDVSCSAVSKNLRRGQNKLIGSAIEVFEEDDS
jgi:predicted DNA binding protein